MINSTSDLLADRHIASAEILADCVGQLRTMARQLWHMAKACDDDADIVDDNAIADLPNDGRGPGLAHAQLVWLATSAYEARRERDRMFGGDLFAEPAWDMLLDLFIQTLNGQKVHTKAMLAASAVPETTALRYLDRLEAAGFVYRASLSSDRRVRHVVMSGKCVDLMVRYFSAVAVQWMSAPSSEAAVDGVTIHDRHRRRPGGAIRQGDKVVHFAFHGQGRAVVAPMAVPLPAIGSPATGFSVERIMAKIKRIRANEARLLVCFLESPDRSIAIGEMVAVLNGLGGSRPEQPNPVSVDKVMVRRSLRQVRMALIGIGLNQAIVWAAGRYTMSTEAAARITGYLYDR